MNTAAHDVERGTEDGVARSEDHRREAEHQCGEELVVDAGEERHALDPRAVAVHQHLRWVELVYVYVGYGEVSGG